MNTCSDSEPQTCCFYEELHATLGGDPTTTPKHSVDTSRVLRETSSNNEEDNIDEEEEEENVRQASILPDSQELFLILEPIPSQDQFTAECDAREGASLHLEANEGTTMILVSSSIMVDNPKWLDWKKRHRFVYPSALPHRPPAQRSGRLGSAVAELRPELVLWVVRPATGAPGNAYNGVVTTGGKTLDGVGQCSEVLQEILFLDAQGQTDHQI
ncbi:hypothetical protein UY3_05134 [Chelonia mydas]|uniref:Uncharacterized protein n=1 Tax=Chelonia mydas TaxID=8469 RepID=M7BKE1_CHEMY|nr:hypothetical protein UY3_05134 [Chelonia mydas]